MSEQSEFQKEVQEYKKELEDKLGPDYIVGSESIIVNPNDDFKELYFAKVYRKKNK